MSDLISREEAITVIELHMRAAEEPYQRAMNYAFDVAISCLLNLPSVEPTTGELVRCKYCDWWERSDNSGLTSCALQGRCKRYGFYPTGDYYCAGAEPKGEGK